MSNSPDPKEDPANDEAYLRLSPAELRVHLEARLHTDSELDAFCLDYHPEVHQQFSSGMSRSQKLNLLIRRIIRQRKQDVLAPSGASRYGSFSRRRSNRRSWRKLKPMVLGAIIFDWSRRVLEAVSQTVSAAFGNAALLGVVGSAAVGTGVGVFLYKNQHNVPVGPNEAVHKRPDLVYVAPDPGTQPPVPDMDQSDLASSDFSFPLDSGLIARILDIAVIPARTSERSHNLNSQPPDLAVPTDLTSRVDLLTAAPDAADVTARYANPPPPWMPMVTIHEGSMTPAGGDDARHPSLPIHIGHKFLIARYEVTQRQYREVIKVPSPSHFSNAKEDELPVENISWLDAIQFCNALSLNQQLPVCYHISKTEVKWLHGLDCPGFRLPTEDEWLYAAYAGRAGEYAGGADPSRVAWYFDNADYRTHPVGRKSPNAWQLHDMSGNVGEWIWDQYLPEQQAKIEGTAILANTARVIRGGSYYDNSKRIALTRRHGEQPQYKSSQVGLRVVRTTR